MRRLRRWMKCSDSLRFITATLAQFAGLVMKSKERVLETFG